MLPSSDLFTVDCFPLVCLSDASFLGKVLVLLAYVKLHWKVIARYKYSSLFGLVDRNGGKKSFITLAPGSIVTKTFFLCH